MRALADAVEVVLAEGGEHFFQLGRGGDDQIEEDVDAVAGLVDVKHDECARGGVGAIENVIEHGRELVDVFAIEWRDERAGQCVFEVVRDLVAPLLDRMHGLCHVGCVAIFQGGKRDGAFVRERRLLLEKVEEAIFVRQQRSDGALKAHGDERVPLRRAGADSFRGGVTESSHEAFGYRRPLKRAITSSNRFSVVSTNANTVPAGNAPSGPGVPAGMPVSSSMPSSTELTA